MIGATGLFLMLVAAPVNDGPGTALPAYPDALNCAALTHAAMQNGKGGPDEAKLFDQLIFWAMATADSGRKAGKTEKQVDAEVQARSAEMQPKLKAGDPDIVAAHAACVARVPAV